MLSVAVTKGVINVNVYTLTSVVNSEKKAVVFFKIDSVADIFNIGLNRSFTGVFFKIMPERSVSYPHVEGRNSFKGIIQGNAENFGVNLTFKLCTQTENV